MSDNVPKHEQEGHKKPYHTLRNLDAMSAGPSVPLPPIVETQAAFALNVLRDSGINNSAIVSPISISIALAMVYLGAQENTAKQIKSVIAPEALTDEEIHQHYADALNVINSNGLNVTLESANKAYIQKGLELVEAYLDGFKKHYQGDLELVDFGIKEETAKKINDYVSLKTHEKIKNLVDASSLDDATRLLLINAIYFKGKWHEQFNKDHTKEADFYVAENKTVKVQMMSVEKEFAYYEADDYQVLGLPYEGKLVSLYIILPKERYGLETLLNNLNGPTLAQLLAKRGKTKVQVKLPRFKIETSLKLKPLLQKLGVEDAFNSASNLKGINANQPLQVSDVLHKAFIEVNEEGTEAAAATYVQISLKSAPLRLTPPPKFTADHPFLYAIVSKDDHSILFAGINAASQNDA